VRTYGRIASPSAWTADSTSITADSSATAGGGGGASLPQWVEINTDSNGNNDLVWLVTLTQVLQLNLNESPFFAANGIPAEQSVIQQIFPDYYVALTQQNFSQYFASLQVSKQSKPTPTYNVAATTNSGVTLNATVPIPT
jgi:hypothetical protein